MYIVGFSGPPHCGKDSIARTMSSQFDSMELIDSYIMSLARPMRYNGMSLLGFDPQDDEKYAEVKDQKHELFGDTLRNHMIAESETFIKPRYGKDFWGRKLKVDAGIIWNENVVIFVPDFGFKEEVEFFEREIGCENVLTVQIERDGCDFSKDSRDYVCGENMLRLYNNWSLEWAGMTIQAHMISMGWTLD